MTPRQFYNKHHHTADGKAHIESVCKKANTTLANFRQCALYNGGFGKHLGRKLEQASNGEMSLREILFPDEFEKKEEGAQVGA